jgi:MoxR-like ATPase
MPATAKSQTKGDDKSVVAAAEKAVEDIAKVRLAIASVIFGQEDVIERTLITILSGGHGLLVGLPGLAKTKLVETLGTVLGLAEQRIQFTPDLMPSDILGSEILRTDKDGTRSFHFVKGPIFAQLLMADEISRTTLRPAGAVPCSGDAKSAGAGGHLSVAGGSARPFSDADRRKLSEPCRRKADFV